VKIPALSHQISSFFWQRDKKSCDSFEHFGEDEIVEKLVSDISKNLTKIDISTPREGTGLKLCRAPPILKNK
jgi:hypothetical protein